MKTYFKPFSTTLIITYIFEMCITKYLLKYYNSLYLFQVLPCEILEKIKSACYNHSIVIIGTDLNMQKISELKKEQLIYNHIIYDNESERHLAKHTHSLMEIIYVLSGEISYTIEDKKFTARPGDLILIKPYSYHYFTIASSEDYEKIGILFPANAVNTIDLSFDNFLLLPCLQGRIRDIFDKVDFYFHNCPQPIFENLLLALANELLINISLFYQQQVITSHNPVHPLIERAINYINENLFSLNTVKELADRLSVSEGYLKVLFTEQMKIPPKKYITEKKMLMAKSMINDGIPPTQVSIQCGFSNYVTFYRLYLKTFQINPITDHKNRSSK